MKKTVSVLLAIILVLASFSSVFAASMTGKSSGTVSVGDQVTVTFNVSSSAVSSGSINISYDSSKLQLVSGKWSLSGTTMANFDGSKKGVFAFSSPQSLSGAYFKVTFKALAYGTASVSASAELKNGSSVVGNVSAKVSVTISCAHKYGGWTETRAATCDTKGSQERTCSVCGNVEKKEIPAKGHKYGSFTTTKEATCTEKGSKERVCSVCNNKDVQSIPALGHTLGAEKTVTKEATCTTHGEASGTCTRCGQTATVETAFAPHSYDAWTDKVAATCTEGGVRVHSCTVCGFKEESKSLPLGHDFTNGTLVREASIAETGLYEGTCSRCGAAGSITSPCSYTDEATGIFFETEEGSFEPGTELLISEAAASELAPEVLEKIKALADNFFVYDIAASKDGADAAQNGILKTLFPLPESCGRNTAVYRILEDGSLEEADVVINTADKTIETALPQPGRYVLASLDRIPEEPGTDPYLISTCGLGAAAAVFLGLFLAAKKKKNQ